MKILYIEEGQAIPAILYLEDTDPAPIGYRVADAADWEEHGSKLNGPYLATDSIEDPTNVDYDILALHKKRYFVDGELITVEYYKDLNLQTMEYRGLAVKEVREYVRNTDDYVMYRTMAINWYFSNGNIGTTKNTLKVYTMVESMNEGITRRANRINELKASLLVKLVTINQCTIPEAEAEATPLLVEMAFNIGLYKEGNTSPLINGITVSSITFLDLVDPVTSNTIRNFLINNL